MKFPQIHPSPHHPITTPPPDPSSYLLERSHLKLPKCDHRGHAHEKTGLQKRGIQEKKHREIHENIYPEFFGGLVMFQRDDVKV